MFYYGIANGAPAQQQWRQTAHLPLDPIDSEIVASLKVWELRDRLANQVTMYSVASERKATATHRLRKVFCCTKVTTVGSHHRRLPHHVAADQKARWPGESGEHP